MARSVYLRLSAPVMSFGTARVAPERVASSSTPTRSAVLGLVAASLGLRRGQQWPDWLGRAALRVRIDNPGVVRQVTQNVGRRPSAQPYLDRMNRLGAVSKSGLLVSNDNAGGGVSRILRDEVQDATFLVELTVADGHLYELHAALADPVFGTYLGRRYYAPTFPFVLGTADSVLGSAPVKSLDGQSGITTVRVLGAGTVQVAALDQDRWLDWWASHAEQAA